MQQNLHFLKSQRGPTQFVLFNVYHLFMWSDTLHVYEGRFEPARMLSEAIAMADAVGEGGSDASVLRDASESPSETEQPSPNNAEGPGPSETEESGPSETKESGPSETKESGSSETEESGSSKTEELGQSTCKRTHKRVRRVSNWKKTTWKKLRNTGQGYISTSKKVVSWHLLECSMTMAAFPGFTQLFTWEPGNEARLRPYPCMHACIVLLKGALTMEVAVGLTGSLWSLLEPTGNKLLPRPIWNAICVKTPVCLSNLRPLLNLDWFY